MIFRISIMPAPKFGATDILHYDPKYRLLICRECRYAIQKSALESHFLRHKIYRGDRQRLLSSIAQLDLLEPHDVSLPAPGSTPIEGLPVLEGYRCSVTGCRHLTVSSKRMRTHWSGVHGSTGSVPIPSDSAFPAKLQTFFRGTKVRYFEVILPDGDGDGDGDDGKGNGGEDDHEVCEGEDHENITATLPTPRLSAPPEPVKGPSPIDCNLETLFYFHHFITTTSLTLPGAVENPQSAKPFWQTHVIPRTLRRRWLMCGLLAVSAHHLAALTDDDTITKRIHYERGTQFTSEFSAGMSSDVCLEVAEIGDEEEEKKEAKKIGEQFRCLLGCVQYALAEPKIDCCEMAGNFCQLRSIMSVIRGCVGSPDSSSCHDNIRHGSHRRQEDLSVQGPLQTRSLPHGGILQTDTSASDNSTPSILLNLLHSLPSRLAEGLGRPDSAQDVISTLSSITILVECCDISFSSDEAGAVWTWLINVPAHFDNMIALHRPAALVVLAHWAAVLLKRAERVGCWFLKGLARTMVVLVKRQLSVNGHEVLVRLVDGLMGLVQG